jgi:uncharacterized protein (DUF1330 family)
VVTAVPNQDEMPSVQECLQGVLPLLVGVGGTSIRRLKTDRVVGGRAAGMTLVADFESADAAASIFESEAYLALLPARERGFREMNILLTREM